MADNKRGRLWTTSFFELQLLAAASGQSGQKRTDMSNEFITKTGRNLYNVTASRIWLNGVWRWGTTTGAVTPIWGTYTVGILRGTSLLDAVDIPDIGKHNGDLMLHDQRVLLENSEGVITPLVPASAGLAGSVLQLQSKGQRKLARETDTIFLVGAKSSVTEQDVALTCSVTILWLLP